MAVLSSDKTYVTVKKGDTLSEIVVWLKNTHGISTTVSKLAKLNNIKNVNRIYINQKIKLSTSSSASTSTKNSSNAVVIDHFGEQSNAERLLFATWTWNKSNTDKYEYIWYYATGDGVWFIGSKSSTEDKQCTYSAPDNATKVRFKVKPISKTKTVNKKETNYWTADWSSYQTYVFNEDTEKPEKPSAPDVEIDKFKLTAELNNVDSSNKKIQFQIVKNDTSLVKTITAEVVMSHVAVTYTVSAGNEYKVRCRAVSKNNSYSEWTEYSENKGTITAAPKSITELKALSETSVRIDWSSTSNATGYEIEYTTKEMYFDHSDQTTTITHDQTNTYYIIEGLESGQEYFFRVRATNTAGESAWTSVKSIVLGKAPAAPTTWSSSTTVIAGEDLILYWVHNSEDGSSQIVAQLEIYINNVKTTHTVQNTTDEDEKDKTSFYTIDTSAYAEGTVIKWRVKTAGITNTYGEWSVQRTVDVYAPPTLELSVTDSDGDALDTISSFPFYIRGLAGPSTQTPIGYHVSVTSKSTYETTDNVGNTIMVNIGEEVYSNYFDITDVLLLEMLPSSINLENNVEYTVTGIVSMNSGLTAESSVDFTVSWTDKEYHPNAEISIDNDTYSASIRPYCEYYPLVTRKVILDEDGLYSVTSEVVDVIEQRTLLDDVYTITGDFIYSGTTTEGEEIYFSIVDAEEASRVEGITLSVYRREFDGTFTEIATGIDNAGNTYVTDPHPSLDYARYRIVAIEASTGAVSSYDVPGEPVGCVSVIIQWDEEWTNFDIYDNDTGDALEQPEWGGSMLKLPYNVDVSDDNSLDVALVNYIGREHPVTYYGTQIGQTATWSVEVPKTDKETLYALRRLARYQGDVYVREPSGSGYWANVSVSYSQNHCEVTIPVTFNITRVEGGV